MNRHRRVGGGSNKLLQSFRADLNTNLNPRIAHGSNVATFTRATDETYTYYQGMQKTASSGQAALEGNRTVKNVIANASSATLAVAATDTITVAADTVYVFSMGAGTGVVTFTGTATGSTGTLTSNASSRTSKTLTITGAGTIIATASVATVVDYQMENLTGSINQNPSEYVSSGVLSSPWHGSGIDGTKSFSTHNGNTVSSTGIVTENTGPAINSSNSQFVELTGVSGTYVSTPDSAAIPSGNGTSDTTWVAWIALEDWTPAADMVIVAKYIQAANQRSFSWRLDDTGSLKLFTSADGTALVVSSESDAITGFANGTGHWVGTTFNDVANTTNFYTSDQPLGTSLSDINWVQLGNADISHVSAGIFDSTAPVEVGSNDTGSGALFAGKISRAVVIASTDPTATPAVDFNANDHVTGSTWASSTTGETWTNNGAAKTFGVDIPAKWDADGPLGISTHEARTNVILQSNAFTTTWTDVNATPAANYAIAPDGTKTAWRLVDDGATGTGAVYLNQALTIVTNTDYTWSAYVKADQLSWVLVSHINYDESEGVYFDLADGAAGTAGAAVSDYGIESVGDGWYRVWTVYQSTTDVIGGFRIYVADADGDVTVDLDGTSSILVWGAQVEAGTFPTPYIATEGTAVARNAGVLTYSAAGNADSFPMTASVDFTPNDSTSLNSKIILSVDDETNNNRALVYQEAVTGRLGLLLRSGGSTEANIVSTIQMVAGTTYKIAFVINTNDIELYMDGVSVGADSSASTPTVTTIHVGSSYNDSQQANGNIRNVKIFSRRLTDSQVAAL